MSIKNRQNDERILKLQYSARFLYNAAEVFEHLLWTVCISTIFCGLYFKDNIALYISTVLIILDSIFVFIENMCVKYGAMIRNYIDESLFSLDTVNIEEQEKIISIVVFYIEKLRKKAMYNQITHSGTDSTRGVRDWYNIDDSLDNETIIYNCQSQNIGFDRIVSIVTSALGVITMLLSTVFIVKFGFKLSVILAFCPAFFMGIKTILCIIIAHKHNLSAQTLNGIFNKISDRRIVLIETQQYIMKRRSILYVPSSIIYNMFSKPIHRFFKY